MAPVNCRHVRVPIMHYGQTVSGSITTQTALIITVNLEMEKLMDVALLPFKMVDVRKGFGLMIGFPAPIQPNNISPQK